ncbi:MAG TPA: DUF3306 domain-containing protein [Zeimonas sp.]
MSGNEGFLSRWSKRKHDSRNAGGDTSPPEPRDKSNASVPPRAAPEGLPQADAHRPGDVPRSGDVSRSADAPSVVAETAGASARAPGEANEGREADDRPLELPPIDSLTPQSDFRPFMQAGVDAATRNAALAQLFRDPHFNVMDGLDVYIDDYNKTEPIPPTMLAKLKQLHGIGLSDEEIEHLAREGEVDAEAHEPEQRASATPAADPAPTEPLRVAQADALETNAGRDDDAAEDETQETQR